MVLKTLEGAYAVGDAVAACDIDVAACYPITPSTHVAERLAKHYADGALKEYIAVESEHSAMSALVGASAAGGRAFTASSAQGLFLMHEVLFAASGMRLPIVMLVANRAVSSPLNIWNDEQDSVSERDAGWIQLYCESNQEAVDSIPIAFKIAEQTAIPTMVCVDGHYLTHAVEQLEIPDAALVKKFLPAFNPKIKLDPKNPVSLGVYAPPQHYQDFREDLDADLQNAKKTIVETHAEYAKLTGRSYGNGLVDALRVEDADRVIIGMGSAMGNAKAAALELRTAGEKVGVLRLRSLRPFPREEIKKALAGKKIAVVERDFSPGGVPPVYGEVVEALGGTNAVVSSFHGALGGREINRMVVKEIFEKIKGGKPSNEWIKGIY
ncbi:pyruvate ferredoxin oxidoreductase [Candidatus Micrarchaeota archaeon]|nr:pyruvate ferredoxin oxidoreductase [Candidatus Micrarchaeota archaeon]